MKQIKKNPTEWKPYMGVNGELHMNAVEATAVSCLAKQLLPNESMTIVVDGQPATIDLPFGYVEKDSIQMHTTFTLLLGNYAEGSQICVSDIRGHNSYNITLKTEGVGIDATLALSGVSSFGLQALSIEKQQELAQKNENPWIETNKIEYVRLQTDGNIANLTVRSDSLVKSDANWLHGLVIADGNCVYAFEGSIDTVVIEGDCEPTPYLMRTLLEMDYNNIQDIHVTDGKNKERIEAMVLRCKR